MIPEIYIRRAANLMLKRYGEKALEASAARADELAAGGDHDGAGDLAPEITDAVAQLANKTRPGPGIRRKAEPAALQRAPNSPEHGALQVRCPALTRPSADIIATAADDPIRKFDFGEPRCVGASQICLLVEFRCCHVPGRSPGSGQGLCTLECLLQRRMLARRRSVGR